MGYYMRALAIFQAPNSPYAQWAMRDLASIGAEVGETQFAAWWKELSAWSGDEVRMLAPEEVTVAEIEPEVDPQEAQLLSGLAQAAVAALRSDDPAVRQELAGQLETLAAQLPPGGEDLRQLIAVLGGMLRGEEVTAQARRLRGPYLRAYQAVAALTTGEMSEELAEVQALAALAASVVETLRAGDPQQRAALAAHLEEQIQTEDPPPPLRDFLALLQAMLRGEDTSALVAGLAQPFLGIYQEMLSMLSGEG